MCDDIIARLALGDRRTTGAADDVAASIAHDQAAFDRVFAALWSRDAGLAMRSADAVEKAARVNPALIAGHSQELLELARDAHQQEVQWHVAQLLSHAALTEAEQEIALAELQRMHEESKSRIVQVTALESLVRIALQSPRFRPAAREALNHALASDAPLVRARARKLLREIERLSLDADSGCL